MTKFKNRRELKSRQTKKQSRKDKPKIVKLKSTRKMKRSSLNVRQTKKQIKLGNYTPKANHLYKDVNQENNLSKTYLTFKDVLRYFKNKRKVFVINPIQHKYKSNTKSLRSVKRKVGVAI